MKDPTPEELAALRADLAPRLRDLIDAQLVAQLVAQNGAHTGSQAARASDVDAVLARSRAGRRRVLDIGVPAALATASLAAFVLVRPAPPPASPRPTQDVVRISYAEHDAPASAFTIDLVIQGQ